MDFEILMLVIIYITTLLVHCGRPRGHIYHLLVSRTSSFHSSRIKVQLTPQSLPQWTGDAENNLRTEE